MIYAKHGPKDEGRSRARSVLIALLVVGIIGCGIWAFKSFADGSSAATPPASESSIWDLKASSIDLDEVKSLGVPVVIDFGSDECVPCKAMAPVLAETNETLRGKALVKFVDVWEHPEAADGFPVRVIPTQVFFRADGSPYVPTEGLAEELGIELYGFTDEAGDLAFTIHSGALTQEQMDAVLADMGVS